MATQVHALIPLDGSDLAEGVIPAVRGLGPAQVTLLRVLEPDAEGRERAERYLQEAAERVRASGLSKVTTVAREGKPSEAICESAARLGVSLIALTTHGRTGFDGFVLGSVAEKVIRTTSLPVLVVRSAASLLLDRVLVPLDGSEKAWRAVEVLKCLVDASKVRLTLAGVVETLGAPPPLEAVRSGDDLASRFFRLQMDGLKTTLLGAAERARTFGFDTSVEVTLGRPAARILDLSDSLGATLIALTTHGRSGLTRWVLGSVAEQILRVSKVPLLICR